MTTTALTGPGAGTAARTGQAPPSALDAGGTTDVPTPPPSRTPQLLRRLQALVVLVVLLAGAVCYWVVADLRTDLASAPNLAQQYARLSQVQHNVDAAAEAAARSVLLGESSDGANAKAAVAALATANGLLVEAAKDRPQDAEALRGLGNDLLTYSLSLGAAIGEPLAQAKPLLATANAQRDTVLNGIQSLQTGLTNEASARPWSQTTPWAVVACLAALAAVVWVSWTVARRSHRVLNLGLVGAGVALLLLIGVVTSAQGTAASASGSSRGTQFTKVVNLATAVRQVDAGQRVLSTAVLTQTWTDSASTAWSTAYKEADAAVNDSTLSSVGTAGKALVGQLSKGDWKGATSAITSSGDTALATASARFVASAQQNAGKAVAAAATAPETGRATLVFGVGLAVVLSLAGAGLGAFGIARRLQEYR
jgi:hypothetical protein